MSGGGGDGGGGGDSGGDGSCGGEGGHGTSKLLSLAKRKRRGQLLDLHPASVHPAALRVAVKLDVSTNFMVTDLCFCTFVRSFGSSGLSLA